VNLYAESSAVLAWLLDEPSAPAIRQLLGAAECILASDLALIECDRVLLRAAHGGDLTEAETADRRAQLAAAASHWHIMRIAGEVVDRARQPFPGEPLRTLDAIHVASTLVARGTVTGLSMLSLDVRVRRAAISLGIEVLPPASAIAG
jgi:predicted nucleic acid-binding protein